MKILLANPSCKKGVDYNHERYYIRSGSRWPHSGTKIKGKLPHYLPFPFSLAYSASLLKESFFNVFVIDAIALDISENELIENIRNINPDLVFYEITTPTVDYDLLLAKRIKNNCNSLIAIGGAHASVFASEILLQNESVNFVLKGEYEWSLLKLAQCLEKKNNDFPSGSSFRENGFIVDKGPPDPIECLDRLPFPLRDIFPSNDKPNPLIYWDGFCQSRPLIQMQSSRGCSFSCYFCLWKQVMYSNGKYRTFSARRIVDEMQESVIKYKAKEIYFDDDSFTTEKKHVISICEEILKKNLKVKWSCMADAISLSEDILRILSKSGCIGIKFGIESGSEKILRRIGKPIDIKKIKAIVKRCKKIGIKTHATFTVGLLGEGPDDIKKTMRLADSLDVDSIQISAATPFPGTEFFKIAKEKGFLKKFVWEEYDGKNNKFIFLSGSEKKEVEKLVRNFIVKWFFKRILSPIWCLGHIHIMIRSLKGLGCIFLSKQVLSVITDELGKR